MAKTTIATTKTSSTTSSSGSGISLTEVISVIQNGVTAINNLATQITVTFGST